MKEKKCWNVRLYSSHLFRSPLEWDQHWAMTFYMITSTLISCRDGARAKGLWGAKFGLKKNKIATSRIKIFSGQFKILSSIWVNNSNWIVEIGYVFKTTLSSPMFYHSLWSLATLARYFKTQLTLFFWNAIDTWFDKFYPLYHLSNIINWLS